ncbi:transcription-repair coupling factor [Clostridium argentinense CDC 2741]|uniref:Transcription-repair-coupling factor n=1 Tax=Clostridium argentinense CDC 2741 TaxID=1418104 RepID=A0A0C1UF60_9CLOT|nr:transcription-repair coupling factor [Clostridium argentinense]ARC83607.1 transcription-repair coupling factor [Clostridium argentinense]KIE45985.1 transcription-repair coupling factor [Clostridium argentinense CDC 2741]NFF40507.1 transcription-repair coupling factor [Clostridium argentinense]NFP50825.1 transcription-repair coupling factor [Clostridium argentinense]NFP74126.1 transcription-repair coupling factor [Clostridium argentinense]
MRLNGLMMPLRHSEEFREISKSIKGNNFPIGIYGVSESAKSYLINGIYEEVNKKILIVTHNDVEAKNICEDLSFYLNDVYYFPTREVVFYNIDAISGDLRWERLKIFKKMLEDGPKIIVASIESLLAVYTPVDLFKNYIFSLKVGDIVDIRELSEKLIQCGYERSEAVETKGQFSIRGGILDIFPPIDALPYRVEFFDDEVDSIRTFNTDTQRSIEKVSAIEIFPGKEIIMTSESLKKAYDNISKDFNNSLLNFNKKKEKEAIERLTSIVNSNIEALKETWSFETIDSYIPYLYESTSTFFDYLKDSFIIVDDVQRCNGKLESVYFEFKENYENFLRRGNILPRQGELLISKEETLQLLENKRVLTIDAIAKSTKILKPRTISSFSQITIHDYHGQLDYLIDDIKDKKDNNYRTVILSGTRTRGERLIDTLRDRGIEASYKDIIDNIELGQVVVTFGNALKGFEYPELKVCVISDKEVFGQSKRKTGRKGNKKGAGKIKSFTELKLGDYVVHANHGIGVYKGINQLEVQGHKKDFLELTYNNGDTLYVPVEQLDLVQKYIGSEGKSPKVNKLGGSEWVKAKNKVKKSIEDIAEDLVKLYATRAQIKGHKYGTDTIWQKQFEDEFPYDETPDQLTAIEEIKKDMESHKPMDRLLCGDVGYGKTEVALRAAFKCVMDGKQVAFLVPTTILAEQHYKNMLKRYSDFPLKVDMISRFRTASQTKAILKSVKEGNVDILVGTHRILQKDVSFKDLGLLIVDEEQRFGVTHKEKIKSIKKNIDVLTLTATPIPRTLHMSLTGVRDISVIETPPEERYPVQTYVVEFNDQLIRDGIMRELNRNGQVFFVYNRVETIKEMASYLGKLIPEARIAVAHGQMTERELEKIILDFIDYKYDILVCTTIIETGIDIQNTNTMIIYDADKMGLSQLYQLRGRVGRTNRIAYAYFTYMKDKILTEVAEKRLKAIKDFTELGSGFKIAMRDLEIRGAGNIMGSAQHGHMATVGYDLYCRMLEDMIKLIKGDIEKEPIETTVEIKIDAYIPSSYVKDETQKIEVYKKIASIDSYEYMMELQDEIEDRFSDIPPTVYNLMNIAYLRSMAKEIGIIEIKEVKNEILITFESKQNVSKNLITGLLDNYISKITFKMGEVPVIAYKIKEAKKEELLDNLIDLIKYMKEFNGKTNNK